MLRITKLYAISFNPQKINWQITYLPTNNNNDNENHFLE